jgi:hypothetical protein
MAPEAMVSQVAGSVLRTRIVSDPFLTASLGIVEVCGCGPSPAACGSL